MKIKMENIWDQKGNLKAVQIPIEEWKKLEKAISTYEQASQVKEDLLAAYEEVREMNKGMIKKQTLSEFLYELI
jgi:aminoglycoside phosphotransferase (APT) family kinase protein